MQYKWLIKRMSFYRRDNQEKGHILYISLGPLEIILIVVAVILVFGVGKLANIGGALGKSIREFREEKNKTSNTQQLTTKANNTPQLPANKSKEEGNQPVVEPKEEKRD